MSKLSGSLALPIEEQQRIARDVFNMPHAEWVEHIKKTSAESDEFLRKLLNDELEDPHMTPEQIANFQSKMDSGNPP